MLNGTQDLTRLSPEDFFALALQCMYSGQWDDVGSIEDALDSVWEQSRDARFALLRDLIHAHALSAWGTP